MTTEEKILKAAEEIFIQEGYDGARMQQIADHAEVNKALLHYYFRSKQKLFETILQKKLQQFFPKIGAILFSSDPLMNKLERLVESYIDFLSENYHLPIFIIHSIHKHPEFLEKLPGGMLKMVIEGLNRELRNSDLNDVDGEQLILTIVGMCLFPFVMRPMAKRFLDLADDQAFLALMQERKEAVKAQLRLMLIK